MMKSDTKTSVATRLSRIEGQIRGISRMVEEDRYCIDTLTQLRAARAALQKVEEEILKDHVHHCVAAAFKAGDALEQHRKIEELVGVLGQMTK